MSHASHYSKYIFVETILICDVDVWKNSMFNQILPSFKSYMDASSKCKVYIAFLCSQFVWKGQFIDARNTLNSVWSKALRGTFHFWAGWLRWTRVPMLSDCRHPILTFLPLLCITMLVLEQGFHFTMGFRKLRKQGGGDCLRLSRTAYKKTPRETGRVIERGKDREKRGREERGTGRRRWREREAEDNEAFDEAFLGSICGSVPE